MRLIRYGKPLSAILTVGLMAMSCGDDPEDPGTNAGATPDVVDTGECYVSDSEDYTESGPYAYDSTRIAGYEAWVPRAQGGCDTFPLVGFALGTGTPASNYRAYYQHMASWGMIVVVDPSNLINLNGVSLKDMLRETLDDRSLNGKLLGTTGVVGHSQGGAAVVNAAADNSPNIDALVGLMPALFGSGNPEAAGLYIGGTSDAFGAATDPLGPYNDNAGPAFIADLRGQGHTVGSGRGSEAGIKGMNTAWLRCWLGGDDNACSTFALNKTGSSCAFPGNWAKCEGKNF